MATNRLDLVNFYHIFTSISIFHVTPQIRNSGQFEPGMYAIEVLGELPEDAIEHCENFELEYRAKAKQNK